MRTFPRLTTCCLIRAMRLLTGKWRVNRFLASNDGACRMMAALTGMLALLIALLWATATPALEFGVNGPTTASSEIRLAQYAAPEGFYTRFRQRQFLKAPDLIGRPLGEADSRLKELGFRIDIVGPLYKGPSATIVLQHPSLAPPSTAATRSS